MFARKSTNGITASVLLFVAVEKFQTVLILTLLSPRWLDGVDLHYLDKTNFKGYDGQDYVTIGDYTVESRLGLLTQVRVGYIR